MQVNKADSVKHEKPSSCRFCGIARHEQLIRAYSNSVVVPSLGAFIEGWTLVIPRRHYISIADIPDDEWNIFDAELEDHRSAMKRQYSSIIEFEHGAAGPNRKAGCGTDHAHRHFVPCVSNEMNIRNLIGRCPEFRGRFKWIDADDRPRARQGLDYIWIHDNTGTWITYDRWQPSQVVRRALARKMALLEWDWKKNNRIDIATRTLLTLTQ